MSFRPSCLFRNRVATEPFQEMPSMLDVPTESDRALLLAAAVRRSGDRVRKSVAIHQRHRRGNDEVKSRAWVRNLRADQDLLVRLGRETPTTLAGAVMMLSEVSARLNRSASNCTPQAFVSGSPELAVILDRAIAGLEGLSTASSASLTTHDLPNQSGS